MQRYDKKLHSTIDINDEEGLIFKKILKNKRKIYTTDNWSNQNTLQIFKLNNHVFIACV